MAVSNTLANNYMVTITTVERFTVQAQDFCNLHFLLNMFKYRLFFEKFLNPFIWVVVPYTNSGQDI